MTNPIKFNVTLALILVITAAIYFQTNTFSYVSWDDPNYIINNTDIHQGLTLEGIQTAFTSTRGGMWLPMVWLSYMVDVELFGIDAGAQHIVNLLIHLLSTFLVYFLLIRCTKNHWASLVVAGLFALHPLRVESVAWVTERKDVLSMLFFLLTMITYYYYSLKPNIKTYLLVVLFFSLGLMSKPMLVTLPFVLLLWDYWPLKRLFPATNLDKRALGKHILFRVAEKIPLFILVILFSALTIKLQGESGATFSLSALPISDRVGNAAISYAVYLEKTLIPINLSFFYPLAEQIEWLNILVALSFLGLVSYITIAYRKTKPYLIVGWLWYLGTLFPVSGISQAGLQATADRFTYIPLVGIFIAVAWSLDSLSTRYEQHRTKISAAISGVILICAVLSFQQIKYWENDTMLFSHGLQVSPDNYLAQANMAGILEKDDKLDQAEKLAKQSLNNKSNQSRPHVILGNIYLKRNQLNLAQQSYSDALVYNPNEAYLYYLLGNVAVKQRDPNAAARYYYNAANYEKNYWEAHHKLGLVYASLGKLKEAVYQLQIAAKIQPSDIEVKTSLAYVTGHSGDLVNAKKLFIDLVQKDPNNIDYYKQLSFISYQQRDIQKAREYSLQVLQRKPNDKEAQAFLKQLATEK